jgi:YHS domain-containing protein
MHWNMIVAMAILALGFFMSGASQAHEERGALLIAHEHHHKDTAPAGKDVCPVSGEEIGKGTNITYEYKGKTYRFCCPACVDEFKNDPEKYIENMKKQGKKNP